MTLEWLAELALLKEQNAQLVKERDAAVKCIEDIETYLQWGAPQYAYKVIEEWRGVRDADN